MSRLHGARELDRVLAQLPKQVGAKAIKNAALAGAGEVRKAARAAAPVDEGDLKKSITARATKTGTASITYRIGATARAYYGMFLEFGTSKMSARPWFRPAWEESKQRALDKVGKRLGENITKAARKLAGPYAKSGLARKRK